MTGSIDWRDIDTPAVIVDLDRLEQNITAMADHARDAGVDLRPHFKTHKSLAIAGMQAEAGSSAFTVASLDEAETLIDAGFEDLLLATQIVTEPKLNRAMELLDRGRLILAVDSPVGVERIAEAARGRAVEVSIEIDSGLGRCGVAPRASGALAQLVATRRGLDVWGLFTHGGHAYRGPGRAAVEAAAADEIEAVRVAHQACESMGVFVERRSTGSTPTVLAAPPGEGITEIRPGNYVFRDAMQVALGVAAPESCALTVSATVISRPRPDRVVVDAGAKTLALDRGGHGFDAIADHGRPVDGPGFLRTLSEEHGIMQVPPDAPYRVGDRLRFVPNHACTVVNLARDIHGIRGGTVETSWMIDAAGGTR